MNKYIIYLSFVVFSLFACFSCFSDEQDEAYVSYGVIRNAVSSTNYQILTDKGNTLDVVESPAVEGIQNGKRVLVNFEIKSDKEASKKVYDVKVNGFYNLLSKPIVNESFILENENVRRDSIGNDPFLSVYAWFGGDYININFEALFADSNTKHLINLVYDDTRPSSDTLFLTLRQNSYGEIPAYNDMYLYTGTGRCSFQLSNLLPEGVGSMPVKLSWTEYTRYYNVVERYDTGVFNSGANTGYEKSDPRTKYEAVNAVK
jgi:hypothetical protein